MKYEPMWQVPQSRLENLPTVVQRVIVKDNYWLGEHFKFSPRRMLFGLYVAYQNMKKERNDYVNQLVAYRKHINDLNARIKDLEVLEKNEVFAGYRAVVTYFHWSCGDGCCSDSWHGYEIINQFGVREKSVGMSSSSSSYMDKDSCLREIHEKYGPKIDISYEDNHDNDND